MINTDESMHPRLSKRSVTTAWELFKALVKFAKQKKYIELDITADCRGPNKISKKEAKAAQYRKFTDNDLQNIFNGHIYQPVKNIGWRKSHDYHFWLPLLAAYTGGRVNELAQLLITDIKKHKDIWYLDLTDEYEEGRKVDGKNIKSDAGKRKVPIHNILIELGFVDFVNQPRSGGLSNMVFTSGLQSSGRKRWGAAASIWFNGCKSKPGYKHSCGISGDDKKVFHSFRKSFCANLINHTNVERLAQIVGHEQEYTTTFIYAGEIQLPTLKEAIDKLDYKIDLSHVDYQNFQFKS